MKINTYKMLRMLLFHRKWVWFLTFPGLFESLEIFTYLIKNKHFLKCKDHASTSTVWFPNLSFFSSINNGKTAISR